MQNNSQQHQSFFKFPFPANSVKFSPFIWSQVAVCQSDNFQIVGKGKLSLLSLPQEGKGPMQLFKTFELPDACFDCAWTEFNPNFILSCCGNGVIQLWDISTNECVASLIGHIKEVSSLDCSHKQPNLLLSSGNDSSIRLWDLNKKQQIVAFKGHSAHCNQVVWHPLNQSIFASVGADFQLKIWDLNSNQPQIAGLQAHQRDILSLDFNKYDQIVATSGSDQCIKLWDLRKLNHPINILTGHRYPIKKVKFSPYLQNILASASYDMTINVYDVSDYAVPLKFQHKSHTEFAMGIDFNLFHEKLFASVSWDGMIYAWNWDLQQPRVM